MQSHVTCSHVTSLTGHVTRAFVTSAEIGDLIDRSRITEHHVFWLVSALNAEYKYEMIFERNHSQSTTISNLPSTTRPNRNSIYLLTTHPTPHSFILSSFHPIYLIQSIVLAIPTQRHELVSSLGCRYISLYCSGQNSFIGKRSTQRVYLWKGRQNHDEWQASLEMHDQGL